MRPVTDRFLSALRGSHRMASRARLVGSGQVGVNPEGVEIPIISGDVTLDATAKVRATCDITTTAPWPAEATDLLTPYGNEVFVERGIIYGDEVTEWVSQGYFRLYSVDQTTAPHGQIRLAGQDRMSGILDARVTQPLTLGNVSYAAIIGFLVTQIFPNVPIVYDFEADTTYLRGSHVLDRDRYAFLRDVVQSLSKVCYFDYAGRLQVRDAPDPGTPTFTVDHGPGGVLTELSRSLDRSAMYNGVVATGEAPGEAPPVRGVVLDLDEDSPTYWWGPFGHVPRFYSSDMLTTVEQCTSAAAAMLDRIQGLPYSVDFSLVPNPALEPLDVVEVAFTNDRRPETHVIETLKIPLDSGGAMKATTRKKKLGGDLHA